MSTGYTDFSYSPSPSPSHHHHKQHGYSTSSLAKRDTSSLLHELEALQSPRSHHHHRRRSHSYSSLGRKSTESLLRGDSSIAMSLGAQCAPGKVFDPRKDRCVGLHSHSTAHHALKHAIHRANAKAALKKY